MLNLYVPESVFLPIEIIAMINREVFNAYRRELEENIERDRFNLCSELWYHRRTKATKGLIPWEVVFALERKLYGNIIFIASSLYSN